MLIWKILSFPICTRVQTSKSVKEELFKKWKIGDFIVEKLYYFVQLSMHTVGKFMTKKIAKKLPYD